MGLNVPAFLMLTPHPQNPCHFLVWSSPRHFWADLKRIKKYHCSVSSCLWVLNRPSTMKVSSWRRLHWMICSTFEGNDGVGIPSAYLGPLKPNMNPRLWITLVYVLLVSSWPGLSFTQIPAVSAKASPTPTSCIKARVLGGNRQHQRRRGVCCCRTLLAFEPPPAACLGDKASIRRHGSRQEAAVLQPRSLMAALLISRGFVFGELFLLSQLLLLLINPNRPHSGGGNTQTRANTGRLGWIY